MGVIDHEQELFSTKGASYGTAIELFYKSMPSYNGPLGLNWSHTYDIFLTVNSDGSIVLKDGIGNKNFYTKSGNSYVSPPGDFSNLVKNGDNSYMITYRDGQKKNFRTDGKIVSIVDRFNNTISFAYTGGDLTGITDQAQRTTTIGYDLSATPHRISTITDPNGKVYDFAYQGSALYRVTNPAADPAVSQDRGYWEYQYYPDNYLKSKRDPNGNTSQYTYYADHRMQTATDPELRNRTIVYPTTTGNLRTSTLTEKDGGQWLYTYDVQTGVIKSKTDPNGKVTKYT
jgi:YD repeat-containing protein